MFQQVWPGAHFDGTMLKKEEDSRVVREGRSDRLATNQVGAWVKY